MIHTEMTLAEVLEDPLIRRVMRADRISVKEMKQLLRKAARAREIEETRLSPRGAALPSAETSPQMQTKRSRNRLSSDSVC